MVITFDFWNGIGLGIAIGSVLALILHELPFVACQYKKLLRELREKNDS